MNPTVHKAIPTMIFIACSVVIITGFSSATSSAQVADTSRAQDSIRYFLDDVLITADRMENRVANSTASVSMVRGMELRPLPVTTFSSLFRYVPGFSVIDMDGTGRNPIINARGFYGGGEAEYNIVLIDGKPINDLESGLVNWNLAPLGNIETIEIARGGSSPLYGDAALGAVVNIRTQSDQAGTNEEVLVGSMGSVLGSFQQRGMFGENSYRVAASTDLTDDFRSHSTWRATNVRGDLSLELSDRSSLSFSTINQWVKGENPGPLTVREAAANRKASTAYYQADMKDERRNQLHLDYSAKLSDESNLDASVSYKRKEGTTTRTFTNPAAIFDPMTFSVIGLYDTTLYGDTKDRESLTNQLSLLLQYSLSTEIAGMKYRIVAGVNETYGKLTSKYYDVHTGFANDYTGATLDRDSIVADGSNRRWSHALYLNNELTVANRLSLTVGARYDNIDDRFENV
ncbi:MAG: TonB-dependent receptor, partial [Bacteroidetes bacterium]|nr:TonB-dependent receptor [Bacteroidota bacterium]